MKGGFQVTPSSLSSTTQLFYFAPPIYASFVISFREIIRTPSKDSTHRIARRKKIKQRSEKRKTTQTVSCTLFSFRSVYTHSFRIPHLIANLWRKTLGFPDFRSHLTSKKPKDGVFVVKILLKLLILGLISKRLRKKKLKKTWIIYADSQRQSIVWRIVLFHNSAYA